MDAEARHRVHHRARRRWRVYDDTCRVCALSRTRTKDLNKVGGLSNGQADTNLAQTEADTYLAQTEADTNLAQTEDDTNLA